MMLILWHSCIHSCTHTLIHTYTHAHIHTYTRAHILVGAIGGTFAAGACTSASIRDKDDYMNAAIGGMMAGSIFGFKRTFSLPPSFPSPPSLLSLTRKHMHTHTHHIRSISCVLLITHVGSVWHNSFNYTMLQCLSDVAVGNQWHHHIILLWLMPYLYCRVLYVFRNILLISLVDLSPLLIDACVHASSLT